MKTRILKKDEGRPVTLTSFGGSVMRGTIQSVNRGGAKITGIYVEDLHDRDGNGHFTAHIGRRHNYRHIEIH